MIYSNDYDFQKRYKYIFDVYAISLAQYNLLKNLLKNYTPDSTFKETEIIIIQALVDAIITNLCKIFVSSKQNKITISNLINSYNSYVKKDEIQYDEIVKDNFSYIENDIEKIRQRRNGVIAHSTLNGLSDEYIKDTNLTFETFDRVFEYLSVVLSWMCVPINGYCISGRNKATGKFADDISRKVEGQYKIIQENKRCHKLMVEYMKNNHPDELIHIIYSNK